MAARRKGSRGTSANQRVRGRPLATFSLSHEAAEMLEDVAAFYGLTKSATVEFLIRQAVRREGIEFPKRGKR